MTVCTGQNKIIALQLHLRRVTLWTNSTKGDQRNPFNRMGWWWAKWKLPEVLTFIFSVSTSLDSSSISSIRPPTIFWNWPISGKETKKHIDTTCLNRFFIYLFFLRENYETDFRAHCLRILYTPPSALMSFGWHLAPAPATCLAHQNKSLPRLTGL